jgi:regulator of cell morphogenesis and NO signaling
MNRALQAPSIAPEQTLAELATTLPAASRVFQRHGLDFCCQGRRTLASACAERGLAVADLVDELDAAIPEPAAERDWQEAPLGELMDHVLAAYHESHRTEVPRLQAMAKKVEQVHAGRPDCPRGLADLLAQVQIALEEHMRKEELILFPAVREGRGRLVEPAVAVMEMEHEDHGRNLARLRQLSADFTPPADACNTWRALYLGLAELELAVMRHVHLENHILFPRALR